MVLNEALINAIQHGNLALNSDLRQEDEKSSGSRRGDGDGSRPTENERVHVRATLSRSEAVYIVEDEGPASTPPRCPTPRTRPTWSASVEAG